MYSPIYVRHTSNEKRYFSVLFCDFNSMTDEVKNLRILLQDLFEGAHNRLASLLQGFGAEVVKRKSGGRIADEKSPGSYAAGTRQVKDS